jgi:hypothetical protein
MAISGNQAPHFSTLANFVSRMGPAMSVKGHPISSSYGHLKFPTLG